MTIDLAGAVNAENAKTQDFLAQITAIRDSQTKLGDAQAAATMEQGTLANKALAQELKGTQQAQDAARASADAWGNGTGPENMRAALAQDFWYAYRDAQAAADMVAAKSSSNILENPLQYISDQLTIGNDISAHNAAAQKANLAATTMEQLQSITNSTAIAQKAIAQTLTSDSIADRLQAETLSTQIKAMDIKKNNFAYQIDALKEIHAADGKAVDRLFGLQQAQNSQQQLAISAGHLALAKENAKLVAEERAMKIAQKDSDIQDVQHYTDVVNAGRAIEGLAPIGAKEVERGLKFGSIEKTVAKKWYAAGAVALTTGQKVISSNAAEAATQILQTRAPLVPAMQPVKDYLMSFADMARKDPQFVAKPTADNMVAAIGDKPVVGAKVMLADTTKPAATGGVNIYVAPDIKTMATIPAVANSPFYINAVQPLLATGTSASDPNLLIASGIQALKAGKITAFDLTAGIAEYYKAATVKNNADKDFARVGLPVQTNYTATVKNGMTSMIGNTNRIDLTNLTAVSNLVMRRMILETTGETLGGRFSTDRIGAMIGVN